MVEPQREDRVARLQDGHVRRHVRLGAGVRLDVRVLGPEQLLRAVDGELLDLVDDLAAAVVAAARVPLGVLVRRHAADRLEHRGPREVLGRDQLDLAALPFELAADQRGDVGVELGEAGGTELLERVLGHGHVVSPPRPWALAGDSTRAVSGQPGCPPSAAATRASAVGGRRGALAQDDRLRGREVDHGRGRPGQLAAVDLGGGGAADLCGHVLEPPRVGPPGQVRARRDQRADGVEQLAARACQVRDPHADRFGARPRQPAEAPRRVRQDERVRPRQERARDRRRPAAQLGNALEQQVDVARRRAPSAGSSSRPFSRYSRRTGSSRYGEVGEPVDGVRRDDHRLRRRRAAAAATVDHRRPRPRGPGRSGRPWRARRRSRGSRAARRRSPAWPSPTSSTSAPPRLERRRGASRHRLGRAPADERGVRLPVADVRHQRSAGRPDRRTAGSRRRDPTGPAGTPRRRRARRSVDGSPVRTAFSRASVERVRRDVDRRDARAGLLVGDRERDRAGSGADVEHGGDCRPSSSARHRSTTISVSGRGISARAVDRSVSRRKPHSPRMYATGSCRSRRASAAS